MRWTAHALPLLALTVACGGGSPTPRAATPGAPTPRPELEPAAPDPTPPVARTVDVVEEIFGIAVRDPYRWMEGRDNAERDEWMRAQGAYAAAWFDRIPERDALLARIRELGLDSASGSFVQPAGERIFYFHTAAGASLPVLKVREADGSERTLVDPAALGGDGGHAALNSYAPSFDGARVAYLLSTGGSEVSSIRVMDVATGKDLPDEIPNIWGEFAPGWLPDGSGFFYTQMAEPADGVDPFLNMKTRLHILGNPIGKDVDILVGDQSPSFPIAPHEFPIVYAPRGSKWVVALAVGARQEQRIAVAKLSSVDLSGTAETRWSVVSDYDDQVTGGDVHGDRIYLDVVAGAPNHKIVSVPLAKPVLAKARLEIAEDPDAPLAGFGVAADGLYAVRMAGGEASLLRKAWKAKRATPVDLPYPGAIAGVLTDPTTDGAIFAVTSWTRPTAYFRYDPAQAAAAELGIGATSAADFSAIVAERAEATSADGTRVPISILRRRDLALDGSSPAYVHAYGGYGFPINQSFDATRLAWLERGGVFAVCHVRGGGEKGHRWYLDGVRDKKMNGVADLIACGEHLAAQGYTRADKLAVQGGSMGGILVGRAITHRPDVFAAANIQVGVVNPVRLLEAENGANQIAELGDPRTEAGFKQIHAMDPYVHVEDGTAYPAVVFTVGLNDRRVSPWESAKMAARMQAATSSGRPVLLRADADAGHGVGSTRDQVYEEKADVWSFFLSIAGEPGFSLPE